MSNPELFSVTRPRHYRAAVKVYERKMKTAYGEAYRRYWTPLERDRMASLQRALVLAEESLMSYYRRAAAAV